MIGSIQEIGDELGIEVFGPDVNTTKKKNVVMENIIVESGIGDSITFDNEESVSKTRDETEENKSSLEDVTEEEKNRNNLKLVKIGMQVSEPDVNLHLKK